MFDSSRMSNRMQHSACTQMFCNNRLVRDFFCQSYLVILYDLILHTEHLGNSLHQGGGSRSILTSLFQIFASIFWTIVVFRIYGWSCRHITSCHKWGNSPILGVFLMFFVHISLHPVIKSFWNFIYIISSTLSNI